MAVHKQIINDVFMWRQNVGSVYSSVKILRLMRVVRVARTLDHYIEYGAAVLILLVFMFVLIAHWLACVWYTIGDHELTDAVQFHPARWSLWNSTSLRYDAVQFGWLSTLVCDTSADCLDDPAVLPLPEVSDGDEADATITPADRGRLMIKDSITPDVRRPSVAMSYLTALYYTLSCITSVGFGNVSATTQNEKIFSVCTMILGGKYRPS